MPVVSARQLKTLLWVGLSAPLAWLLVRIGMELRQQNSGLGAEPSEALLHYLGEWALIMLLFAFAVSPLRRRMGWLALGRIICFYLRGFARADLCRFVCAI